MWRSDSSVGACAAGSGRRSVSAACRCGCETAALLADQTHRGLRADEIPQQIGGLWPQWTEADLIALSMQANLLGRVQPQVADAKVEDLLDARAGVAQGGK